MQTSLLSASWTHLHCPFIHISSLRVFPLCPASPLLNKMCVNIHFDWQLAFQMHSPLFFHSMLIGTKATTLIHCLCVCIEITSMYATKHFSEQLLYRFAFVRVNDCCRSGKSIFFSLHRNEMADSDQTTTKKHVKEQHWNQHKLNQRTPRQPETINGRGSDTVCVSPCHTQHVHCRSDTSIQQTVIMAFLSNAKVATSNNRFNCDGFWMNRYMTRSFGCRVIQAAIVCLPMHTHTHTHMNI